MKRLTLLFCCILSFVPMLISAYAAESGTITSTELVRNWLQNGYPDDVGGIYYSDKGITIIVVDLTVERVAEIRGLVSDPNKINFVSGKYSYNEMIVVMSEIEKDLSEKTGIYAVCIDEPNNCILVDVREDVLESTISKYEKKYGQMVHVQIGEPAQDITNINKDSHTWFFMAAMILMIAMLVISFSIKNKQVVLQTVNGSIDTRNILSSKQTVRLVKDSCFTPREQCYQAVKSKVFNIKRGGDVL